MPASDLITAIGDEDLASSRFFRFSLLMSVSGADNVEFFKVAICSVTLEQETRPDEIVLVIDGPVAEQVKHYAREMSVTCDIPLKIVQSATRRGLAASLNAGLVECSFEWAARMDADDIAYPNRFFEQMSYLRENSDLAVIGSSMMEFGLGAERKKLVVTGLNKVRKTLKFKNPINHPTAIVNVAKVLNVGGYPLMEKNQDYGLWLLLAAAGYKLDNLEATLLQFRLTENFYQKRGWALFRHDVEILKLQLGLGYINQGWFLLLLMCRCVLRGLPKQLLHIVYAVSRR